MNSKMAFNAAFDAAKIQPRLKMGHFVPFSPFEG
jgi:hypothetical protein